MFSYIRILTIICTSIVSCWGLPKLDSKTEFDKSHSVLTSGTSQSARIVGGNEAKPHSYPSILSLRRYSSHICGATILSRDWVVTAAHCYSPNIPLNNYCFVAAEHSLENYENEQYVYAVEAFSHPEYSKQTKWHDIALFRVEPPFEFDDKVQPVILPVASHIPAGEVIVAGWGVTEEGGHASDTLQEVTVGIIDLKKCNDWYPDVEIKDIQICAGIEEGGKDSCQGDSGGPLYEVKDKQVIIGIVSFGRGCAREKKPGIYTRVSKYLDWIQNVTNIKLKTNLGGK